MLIPYFYLKVGRLEILQPQNKEYSIDHLGDNVVLRSVSYPERKGNTLFLNGSSGDKNWKMVNVSGNGENFKKEIDYFNENIKRIRNV